MKPIFGTTIAIFLVIDIISCSFSDYPHPHVAETNTRTRNDTSSISTRTKIHRIPLPDTLFIVNVLGIKNGSAESINDILHDDIIDKALNATGDLPPTFMLVVKHDNEHVPVNLTKVSIDAENEGFAIDVLVADDKKSSRLVLLRRNSDKTAHEIDDENANDFETIEAYAGNRLLKKRIKRNLCMSCMLGGKKKFKKSKGRGGGGCGGCYRQPQVRTVYRPVYVPVYVQPHPVCNPCAYG